MHAGRVEEAGALAARIGKDIARHSQQQLKHIDARTDAKGLWAAVKKLADRRHQAGPVDGITALISLIITMLAYRPIASIHHRHLSTTHYPAFEFVKNVKYYCDRKMVYTCLSI